MLVKELCLQHDNKVDYLIFRNTDTNTPIVYRADHAKEMVLQGNLGDYKTIRVNGDIVSPKTACNAYEVSMRTDWFSTNLPVFICVCVLHNKVNKEDYVWCKMFTSEKSVHSTYSLLEHIINATHVTVPTILSMDKFGVTADKKYAFCSCIMLPISIFEYLMNDTANIVHTQFLIDTSNILEFDYKKTRRKGEKPKLIVCKDFINRALKHNTEVLERYRNK